MTATVIASYTPVPGLPQAFAVASTAVSLVVNNQSPAQLQILVGRSRIVVASQQTQSLIPGLSGQTFILVVPDPRVQTHTHRTDAGAIIITSYASGDALPPGSLLEASTLSPVSTMIHFAIERLRAGMPFYARDYGAQGDGVTLDRIPIQAACEAARLAGGGNVYAPGATYLLDTAPHPNNTNMPVSLYLGSNVTLMGDGPSTVFKLASGSADNARVIANFNCLLALGTYNGGGSTAPTYPSTATPDINVVVRDLQIDGNNAGNGAANAHLGIDIQCAVGVRVGGVTVKNLQGTGEGKAVPGVGNPDLCYNTGESIGVSFYSCQDVEVDHCLVYRDTGDSSAGFRDVSVNGITYSNCTVRNTTKSCGFHSANSASVKRTNCHAYSIGGTPSVCAGVGFYDDSNRDVLNVNCCAGNRTTYVGSYPLANTTALGCSASGFVDGGNSHYSMVNCESSFNTQDGAQFFGGPADAFVIGGFYRGNRNGIFIVGNNKAVTIKDRPVMDANTSHEINSVQVATTDVKLTGLQTAPTIPASTADFVNPYPFPILVLVSGGTVTNVQVTGYTGSNTYRGIVAIAAGTPATVVLQAWDKIRLTYTVAPTWTWQALT